MKPRPMRLCWSRTWSQPIKVMIRLLPRHNEWRIYFDYSDAVQWSYTEITKNMKADEVAILNLYLASASASRFYLSPDYLAH